MEQASPPYFHKAIEIADEAPIKYLSMSLGLSDDTELRILSNTDRELDNIEQGKMVISYWTTFLYMTLCL